MKHIFIAIIYLIVIANNLQAQDAQITTDTTWDKVDSTDYKNITVDGDIKFNVTNSDINMQEDGLLKLYGEGPLEGTGLVFTLDNGSVFSHAKNTDKSITEIKGRVTLKSLNDSKLVINKITLADIDTSTQLWIEVRNAEAAFNQLYLWSKNDDGTEKSGVIKRILIYNDEDGRTKYNQSVINGLWDVNLARKVAIRGDLNEINITNGALSIIGDVVSDAGFIIKLDNGLLNMTGWDVNEITSIVLTNKSVLQMTGSRARIAGELIIDGNSNASMGLMSVYGRSYSISSDASTVTVENIQFDDSVNDAQFLNFAAKNGSDLNIKEINLAQTQWGSTKSLLFSGDSKSKLKIGVIDIADSDVKMFFDGINPEFDYINYTANKATLLKNPEGDSSDISNITVNKDILMYRPDGAVDPEELYLENVNMDLKGKLLFSNTDNALLNLINSKAFFANIECSSELPCTNFAVKGNDKNKTSVTVDNFVSNNTASNTGSFTLDDTTFVANNSFAFNGNFTLNNSTANLTHMTGQYTDMTLNNSTLSIGKDSAISVVGDINISKDSALNINAVDAFTNPADVNLINNGILSINQKNSINSITNNAITNIGGDGTSIENLTNNNGRINLYNNIDINNFVNSGDLNIYGKTHVGNLDMQSGVINIYIDKRDNYAALNIGELVNPHPIAGAMTDVNVTFTHTGIFKPGRNNRFEFLTTDKGSLGIAADQIDDSLSILPPWLKSEVGIDYNNGHNSDNGETAWVNVQRLVNYTALVDAVDQYKDDQGTKDLAAVIDKMVDNERNTAAMDDIIDALDYNSGCGAEDEEILYEVHNGNLDALKDVPCLQGLADNISKLKPINNEIFMIHMLNNNKIIADLLTEENRTYSGIGDSYVWFNNTVNGSFLNSKDYVTGYNSIANLLQVGLTGSFINGINTTISAGVNIGKLDGRSNRYSSTFYNFNGAVGVTYLNPYMYLSLVGLYNLGIYDNKRNTEFLDYQSAYTTNNGTVNTSTTNVHTISLKAEVGTEYHVSKLIYDDIYIVPKLNTTFTALTIEDFKEKGTSASLDQKGITTSAIEVGGGLDFYKEFLLQYFLWQYNSFWQPQLSINAFYRFYTTPKTKVSFVGAYPDYSVTFDGANYSGFIIQPKASLTYKNNNIEIEAGYSLDYGVNTYNNHSIYAAFKYNF